VVPYVFINTSLQADLQSPRLLFPEVYMDVDQPARRDETLVAHTLLWFRMTTYRRRSILTLGYDANIVIVNGHASLNSLPQHSINLVLGLSQVRRELGMR